MNLCLESGKVWPLIFVFAQMFNCSLLEAELGLIPPYGHSGNCTWLLLNQTFTYYDLELEESLYQVPVGVIILLSFFYGSISVIAVVGNFLVMWIVATSRRMQNVTNCFIANLALADIVIGLFAIPFQFQAALLQRWNLPEFMCPFCPFVQVLSVNVSIFTLTAIAVDRHRAVLNPLSAPPSKLRAKVLLAAIWILASLLAIPMAVALRVTYVEEFDQHGRAFVRPFCNHTRFSESHMLAYRMILVSVQYLTPLGIISYAYARMALRLWGSKTPGNAQHSRDENLMRNKKKVIKMLVIVVALFAICWLPLQTYNILQSIFPQINGYRYINIIWFCCDWLAMSNSCYNPFIYGIYNEKFKQEFQQRFRWRHQRWHSSLGAGAGSVSMDLDKTLHRFGSVNRSSSRWNRYSSRFQYSPAQHYVYHCANSNTVHHSSQSEIEELCL